MQKISVLSLFDGISAGRLALDRVGIQADKYYASEIDKYAIQVSQKNWSDIIQIGDVTKVKGADYSDVDLLIGGSPCQSFAYSGDGSGFDGKSGLFFEYVRILNELKEINPNILFLLENVKMKKEWSDIITAELGVDFIKINSFLLSGQSRNRLYWTNIPNVTQPEDKGIRLKDILEENVHEKYFYSEKAMYYFDRSEVNKRYTNFKDNKKSTCLLANFCKGPPYNIYVDLNKEYCKGKSYFSLCYNENVFQNNLIRRLTPIECEVLQTLPRNYTEGVSDTQRYKQIGNGWTVDVISHIFKGLKSS